MAGFTGGCLCGAIKYEVKSDPVRGANCHCDDCRRATGATFATNFFVKEDDLVILQGTPKSFDHPADSGNTMTKDFCADCGSQLFGHTSGRPGVKSVKAGSIDDIGEMRPSINVFTSKAYPFTKLPEDTEHFDRMPPG